VNEALKKSLFTRFFKGFSAGVNLLGKVIMNLIFGEGIYI
jgi:hypothetical protein